MKFMFDRTKRNSVFGGVCFFILFMALLPAQSVSAAEPKTPVDDTSNERVVVIGGALTEIIYAIGMEDNLVGVDTTSQYPYAATQLPQVGYQRNLSAEGILSLTPDVIFATDDAGPPPVIEQLRQAGVRIQFLPSDYSLDTVIKRVELLSAHFNRTAQGEQLIARIEEQMKTAKSQTQSLEAPPRVVVLLGTEAGSAMAAGLDTGAAVMVDYAGAENVMTQYTGYKPISPEALIGAAPDALIVVSIGDEDQQTIIDNVLQLPGVAQTPAGMQSRIIVTDALQLLGFGPRIGEAVIDLTTALSKTK